MCPHRCNGGSNPEKDEVPCGSPAGAGSAPPERGPCRGRGPRMFDAGTLRYLVLQRIAEQPRHGYEIIKAIEEQSGGAYVPSPGTMYPMLSMLEDLGYISIARDGNRKRYAITDAGATFLRENRAFVDAIEARARSSRFACSGVVRQAMQALQEALAARVHGQAVSDATLRDVDAIIRKAAADIRAL